MNSRDDLSFEEGPDDDRTAFRMHDDRPRWPVGLPERIEHVYDVLGPYLEPNRAEFSASIMAGPTPDEEAVHWLGIAAVWEDYHRKYLRGARLGVGDERKVIEALQGIAAGEVDPEKLPVSREIAATLLTCYLELADELPYLDP